MLCDICSLLKKILTQILKFSFGRTDRNMGLMRRGLESARHVILIDQDREADIQAVRKLRQCNHMLQESNGPKRKINFGAVLILSDIGESTIAKFVAHRI